MLRVTWGLKYVDQVVQVVLAGTRTYWNVPEPAISSPFKQCKCQYDAVLLRGVMWPHLCMCRRSTSSRHLRRWPAPTGGRTSSWLWPSSSLCWSSCSSSSCWPPVWSLSVPLCLLWSTLHLKRHEHSDMLIVYIQSHSTNSLAGTHIRIFFSTLF